MKRLLSLLALAVVLVANGTASADPSPPSWTYQWTPSPAAITGDPPFSGGVTFTTMAAPITAAGTSDIVATNLLLFGSATAANPDHFTDGGGYSLTVHIVDVASGQDGFATFAGKLTGTFSAQSSNLTNDILDTVANPQTQVLFLGDNKYTVTMPDNYYSPPGPVGLGSLGSIGARVVVEGSDGQVAETPEPTSLLLSCMGLTLAGAAAWRKRRQAV